MALLRYLFIACLVGLSLPACTQDEDEACQVNNDCADGLLCSIVEGNLRGTCLPPDQLPPDSDTTDGGDDDATVDEEVAIPDAAADDDAG